MVFSVSKSKNWLSYSPVRYFLRSISPFKLVSRLVFIIIKKEEADDQLTKSIEQFIAADKPISVFQEKENIVPQFGNPTRKNALQVKKEVEKEELEMMEKEKVWDVPAFLRKQQKK